MSEPEVVELEEARIGDLPKNTKFKFTPTARKTFITKGPHKKGRKWRGQQRAVLCKNAAWWKLLKRPVDPDTIVYLV